MNSSTETVQQELAASSTPAIEFEESDVIGLAGEGTRTEVLGRLDRKPR